MRHLISGADCAIAGAATALAATPRPAAFKNSRRFIPYSSLNIDAGSREPPLSPVHAFIGGYGRNHDGASQLNPVCTASTKVVSARTFNNDAGKAGAGPLAGPGPGASQ